MNIPNETKNDMEKRNVFLKSFVNIKINPSAPEIKNASCLAKNDSARITPLKI